MAELKRIEDVLKLNLSLDNGLRLIEDFFYLKGRDFKRGLISEEEFFVSTYTYPLIIEFLEHHGIHIKLRRFKKHEDFISGYEEWQKTGSVKESPWIEDVISTENMELMQAAAYVYKAIDSMKIPIDYFKKMDIDVEEIPNLMYELGNGYITAIMLDKCLDIDQLTQEADPIGKTFEFHFSGDITATVKITGKENNIYQGIGITEEYMKKEGPISIEVLKDDAMFTIGRIQTTRLQNLFQSFIFPLPKKWDKEQIVYHTHQYRLEAEYKILRLPYLFQESDELVNERIEELTELLANAD